MVTKENLSIKWDSSILIVGGDALIAPSVR